MRRVRNLLLALGENVGIPVGGYLTAVAAGAEPVWALVIAAGLSLVLILARWLLTGAFRTLGAIVLFRFVAGVAVAVITGDARLEIAKDLVITGLIGVIAVVSLQWKQPLIARIRRDLSSDVQQFDADWSRPSFRLLHRRTTAAWAAALVAEMLLGIALVYSVPLTAAVVITKVMSPVVIVALVALTEVRAARWRSTSEHGPVPTGSGGGRSAH